MLALALHHDEIDDDDQIAVEFLEPVELEHDRTQPAANDPQYACGRTLAVAPPRPARVTALRLYEEYDPYGTSAYRAVSSGIEVSAKRYRYTGKERDEETGLDHMGARYYAGWLGRWTSADPIGISGGLNLYEYARSNPIKLSDPEGTAPPQEQQFNPAEYDLAYEQDIRSSIAEAEAAGASQEELDILHGLLRVPVQPEGAGREAPANDLLAFPQNRTPQENFERARVEHQAGQRRLEDLPENIERSRSMALKGTAAYTAVLFGAPFVIEGGILVVGAKGYGPSSTGLYLAGGELSGAVSTYAAGSGVAAVGLGAARAYFEAEARATGLPADVPVPGQLKSSSKLMGVERASPELLEAVAARRTVQIAQPGSEELRYLDYIGAEANVGGATMEHILLRQNPSKAAVLEEFLHGTQQRLGIIERLGTAGAETHVKDFMIRHQRLLGLSDEDVRILQTLKDAGL